ncbi:MAG TPA: proline--tRNA ligase [Planctomycetota bacterium]|nr:proline--tRNA ligase [Planctomycetota bacterium]
MRWSRSFIQTLREAPSDAEAASHKLMVRAGLVRQLSAGVYSYLPLGLRVLEKIKKIVREEMDRAGAVELLLPAMHPAELWNETGRLAAYGDAMIKFTDRKGHVNVLGPTHEEVITDLLRNANLSYRALPVNLYQVQVKFRDEARPRFGIIRTREFIMKDAYSFDADGAGLDRSYQAMYDAYVKIFTRCALIFRPVEADSGLIGGDVSHEFMAIAPAGEDQVLLCTTCRYAANREKAEIGRARETIRQEAETTKLNSIEEAVTPGQHTVDQVAAYLAVQSTDIVKTILFRTGGEFIAALVRGDHEVNPAKLQRAAKVAKLELATPAEIEKASGGPVGFTGPVGLPVRVIGDLAVQSMRNFVTGGNRLDLHLKNVNSGRDFQPEAWADIRYAKEGDPCPKCGAPVRFTTGIEVGHVFKLGTKYSEKMKCEFLDEQGKRRPMIMGCYGIGITRIAAAAIENHHDEAGIIWTKELAPYQVEVVSVKGKDEKIVKLAEDAVATLEQAGFEVLWDDRDESPGVKFADADLLGIPVRVTIGKKSAEAGTADIRVRTKPDQKPVPIMDLAKEVREAWNALEA